jgi:hypothetical protein
MFEVGKKYEIRMIEGGTETVFWRTVEMYEHPLVKFADSHFSDQADEVVAGEIINVTSPNFISAVLTKE